MKYYGPHLKLDEIAESTPSHQSFIPKKIGPYTLSVLFLFLFLNSIILDSYIVMTLTNKQTKTPSEQKELPKTVQNQVSTQAVPDYCPTACNNQIDALKSSVDTIKQASAPQVITTSASKEYFVAFGGGSNSTDDWQDVPGLTASINSSAYGSIKEARFEASVYIPTGNETAYVRLFNVTDKHPVWFSDVSLSGGTAQLLISNPITLDSGVKTYQVQMKTSLKFQAVLSQARVHITTN